MDMKNPDLSDDGHFLSDTDDEYNEDFEEWDELGNENYQPKQKESELGKLDEQELLRLAAVNTASSHKTTKDNSQKDVDLELNRQAWLSVKGPIIGKRPGRKNAKAFDKEKKSPRRDAPKTQEEAALEKLAFDEIVRETKRGKERADEMGPAGWQKPKVPPTNKRFLRNTLLSTLPSKRRRENKEKPVRQHSDVESSEEYDYTEEIKPDVEEKIDEYRKKRSQNYEDEKFHRKLKAEEKKNFNKAAKQAEKDKKRFDNIMRYGVKIGAKRGKVTQENKKAIFDRYHGVWMQLDKTYRRSDSDSEPSDDDRRSSKQRKYDSYDRSKKTSQGSGYPKGQDYYRYPMDRKHAWQSYYAVAYNYYQYMQQQHPDRKYQEHTDGYDVEPSGSSYKRYEYQSHYNDNRRYTDTDESDREHRDPKRKKRKKHKSKHKKDKKKKGNRSEKKHKKSSRKSRTTSSSDSEREGASGSPDYYRKSKQQIRDKKFRSEESDSVDSESISEQSVKRQQTDHVLDSQTDLDLVDAEHKISRLKSNSQKDLTDVLSDGIYAKIMKEEKNLVAESNFGSKKKHKSVNKKGKHKK